ncbi:MAG: CDP-diacylglycerol--glycerol-3-phosphate 3-phosphatidyltransferase [Dissulfurimicrobium sp.]|uniref:CDP-diacylglycerol--glycerol-3-phosphate 3-phosphatidyltransferase n=1 Tax=Dissulfurimicrobium TaxID=1769732 RepID=UPI001EDA980C|nr:CDP-diacylglycerol--glycerol-3-phosphate 3-phosphatidyltransferase [Dissulfurimicrobium hydrothermale]UKL13393.1 CDP-diacylglycerol--glycerol-3-phosphate 3-phosphatidyltransferase [Dissulfurimicrobium hydrothermale]
MNIPNLFTLIRIVLIPILIIFLINGRFFEALIVFSLAGVTDALDGLIARMLRQKTKIGAILDPIADKLLLTSSYVTLAVVGRLPNWLAIVIISRDIIIVAGVLILFLLQEDVEIKPTVLGKLTTLSQLGTIFIVLLGQQIGVFAPLVRVSGLLTAALTVSSGAHYMFLGISLLGKLDTGMHRH